MNTTAALPRAGEHTATEGDAYDNPYRGASSYGPEDGEVFFGREAEAEQVGTMVLAHRVSFLYAASGAGKSSLLAARVLPRLEARGWLPVEVRLGDDPVASARQSLLHQAVLHPAFERECALELLALVGASVPLHAAATAVAQLHRRLPAKRRLLRKRTLQLGDQAADTLPMLARLCRGGLSADDYLRALSLVAAQGPGELAANENITLDRLCELLEEPGIAYGHARLVDGLLAAGPGFVPLIQHLDACARDCAQARSFPLMLVFDQFEELFTRFADPDPSERLQATDGRPDWRHRRRLLDQLALLFDPAPQAADVIGAPASRPHRLLISIREDYIAELDVPEVRRIASLEAQNAFRLRYLSAEHAHDAIVQPAALYGVTPPPATSTAVVADLLREGSHVEPAPLQVVCETLWTHTAPDGHRMTLDAYTALGRSAGILGSYFGRQLDRLAEGEGGTALQCEALDLLEPLITTNRTRNIIERRTLVDTPFRDTTLRRQAFAFLVRQRILRVERRLRGEFVEIAHEFLIDSILREIRERLTAEDKALRRAVDILALRSQRVGARLADDELTEREFELLHLARGRVAWTHDTRQLMLRAALLHGRAKDPEPLRLWVEAARHDDDATIGQVVERLTGDATGDLMFHEWLLLAANLDQIPPALRRSPALLRAALSWCRADDRALIPQLLTPEPVHE